jgi:hypothetical protein
MNLKHFWVIDNQNEIFNQGTNVEVFSENSSGAYKVFGELQIARCWNSTKEQSFWIPELGGIDWTII